MPINFNFDLSKGRDEKRQREREAMLFAKSLIDEGLGPAEVNQFIKNYTAGKMQLPTERTQMLPPMADVDVPTRSTRVPIQFKSSEKKQKRLFTKDIGTGNFTYEDLPANIGDVETFTYNSKPENDKGDLIIVDPQSGQVTGRIPKNSKNDRAIIKPRPAAGGADPADVALAKDTLKKGQDMIRKGEEMTPEFRDSFESAAQMLGIPLKQTELDPTFMDKARNAASSVSGGMINPAEKRYGEGIPDFNRSDDAEYQRDLEAARKAVAMKLVSPEEAMTRLKQKHGKRINGL